MFIFAYVDYQGIIQVESPQRLRSKKLQELLRLIQKKQGDNDA